jgi:hypothetical protein
MVALLPFSERRWLELVFMIPHRRSPLKFTVVGGAAIALAVLLWPKRTPSNASERPAAASARPSLPAAVPQHDESTGTAEKERNAQANVTVERIRRMLDSLEPVMPGEVENAAAIDLLRWWAQFDPASAVHYAASHPALHGRLRFPAELFAAWLEANGAAAVKWATGLPAGDLRAQLLPAVIAIVARQQPGEALRMAGELSAENRQAALSALFAVWTGLDPLAAVREAQALQDAREQNIALRAVIGQWMERDANAAIAWARNRPPDAAPDSVDIFPPVIGILIEKWAARAPAEAGAFLLSSPDLVGRIQLLRGVAEQWAHASPPEALAWAAQIAQDGDRKLLVRSVLAAVAEVNRQAAADLALTLDSRSREHGLGMVLEQWVARDRAAVLAWTNDLARRQPRLAREVAQSISNPALRQHIIDALGAEK